MSDGNLTVGDGMAGTKYDVFVSYDQADWEWTEGYLIDALIQAGVSVHSEVAFELAKPRLTEFEDAVRQSGHVLLVLSPAYLANPVNQFIDLLAQTHAMDQSTWRVVPLLYKPVDLPPLTCPHGRYQRLC